MNGPIADGTTGSRAAALLDAGAVLPADSPVGDDDTVDTLTTRAYQHPVLGDQTVVRLVPRALGEADDLAMEFLGFAQPERVVEVGLVRQQALGFPAWALVHDPANGHHALALVKEMERLARIAKSRIGPAKEGFDALGERLARAVPHFLPTYYEEAGRAFLTADSTSYAAMMFGKAREAEQAYGLDVDPERQHAVFLEFALAGALTAKALSSHARDLAARCTPDIAYERFRRLCVERTLGGLPPYAAMPTDLRRLAKKAKLDQNEADAALLADVIAAPALLQAPESFWTAYRTPLVRLAADDPRIRGRLLGILPENCPGDIWLAILIDSGATEALYAPAGTVPEEATAPDGPAGWLTRFSSQRARRYRRKKSRLPALMTLVERMTDRLVADGVPVGLVGGLDLDLVDLCLASGVPVELSEQRRVWLPVKDWLVDEADGQRDLLAIAADARFTEQLGDAIEDSLPADPDHAAKKLQKIAAVPGLMLALRHWWDRIADRVTGAGLPTIDKQLGRLSPVAHPAAFAANPDAARRIADHNLAPLLGRTLRAGLFDEYTWPALAQATARLDEIPKSRSEHIVLTPQWPYLIVRRGSIALVLDAEGVILEHLLRVPDEQLRYDWGIRLRYVDRQLLVCYGWGNDASAYWSGSPDDVFHIGNDAFQGDGSASLALPSGGRTSGGRPLLVGDRSEQNAGRVVTDGQAHWVLNQVDDRWAWYEYDPASGTRGRASLPSFFEDGAVDGAQLKHHASSLRPAPAELADSPLGIRNGLLGWRLRTTPDGVELGEGIDGRTFRRRHRNGDPSGPLVGAIRFPGAEVSHGVVLNSGWRSDEVTIIAPDGLPVGSYHTGNSPGSFAAGTRLLPAPTYWHYLRPRDLAGSAALRTVTDEQAADLISEAAALPRRETDAARDADLRALVAAHLPQVTDAKLIAGIAEVLRLATWYTGRLQAFADGLAGRKRAGTPVVEDASDDVTDEALNSVIGHLLNSCYTRGSSAVRLFFHIGERLAGGADQESSLPVLDSIFTARTATDDGTAAGVDPVERADHDWFDLLGMLPAVLYLAASPQTGDPHRETLLRLLETLAQTGLLTSSGRLRRIRLIADARPTVVRGDVVGIEQRRMLVLGVDTSDNEMRGLEYAPDGRFGPVPGAKITSESILDLGGVTAELVATLTALVRANGPARWRPERVEELSAQAGMSRAEAAHLLTGLPTELSSESETEAEAEPLELGVTKVELATARATWQGRSRRQRQALLGMLLPTDVETLWTAGPRLDAVTECWIRQHGRRTPVSDELIVTVARAGITNPIASSEFLHGVANPTTCRWLTGDTQKTGDAEEVSASSMVAAMARALPWLGYHLPADHSIRQALPTALALARQRLADPALTLSVGYLDGDKTEKLAAALGLSVVTTPDRLEIGPLSLPPDTGWRKVRLRPAALAGPDDPILAVLPARLSSTSTRTIEAIRLLLGTRLDGMLAEDAAPDAGEAPHDPSRSAPELVAQVAAAYGLTDDAATLYLQLLALPDPTDRNVARWTGWKPARLKAARAALAGTDLVIEAKRSRAGRSLFLPGGWLALKNPHPPVERWKIPLLTLDPDGGTSLDIVVPIAPAPRLFALAWDRVQAGDAPRFDELVTERRR